MPGYGAECAPRGQCTFGARLSDADIASLAAFVAQQAAAGWPATP
jgi:cytochrome c6